MARSRFDLLQTCHKIPCYDVTVNKTACWGRHLQQADVKTTRQIWFSSAYETRLPSLPYEQQHQPLALVVCRLRARVSTIAHIVHRLHICHYLLLRCEPRFALPFGPIVLLVTSWTYPELEHTNVSGFWLIIGVHRSFFWLVSNFPDDEIPRRIFVELGGSIARL
jgi:hypothetical protein